MSKQPYIILRDTVDRIEALEEQVNGLIREGYIPASDLAIVPRPQNSYDDPQIIIAMMYAPAEAQMVMAMCAEEDSPKQPETGRTNEGNGAGSCLCSDGSRSSFTSGNEGKNEP
jgi:hypothetical protein